MFRTLATAAIAMLGTEYVRGQVRVWFEGVDIEEPAPREDHLARDPITGEYIPRSDAIRRKIDGQVYYFAHISSFLILREQLRKKAAPAS